MFMPKEGMSADRHLTDEQLLMLADGELPAEQATSLQRHLSSCCPCRARATRMERAIADFVEAYDDRFHQNARLAPGVRASLRAQLLLKTAEPGTHSRLWRSVAYAAMLLFMAGTGFWLVKGAQQRSVLQGQATDLSLPDRRLTPGAVQPAKLADLCRMADADTPPQVAQAVKQKVFDEYGLPVSTSHSYELDYLITPQLGGANDPRNLWPEPYASTAWNAHIKDELEDRLHAMVCDGSLDLATAQEEISVDWITAYKKYFRTQVPLPETQARIVRPRVVIPAAY